MSSPALPLVFDRVLVDYLTLGGSRIQWDINEHFREPTPWTFQLQVAEADISDSNWAAVGDPVVNGFTTTDPAQEYFGKEQNAFYRVQLITGLNNTYYSEPQAVTGNLDFYSWGIAQELVRKEILRLRYLHVGIEGFLLKAMHKGTPATADIDPFTQDIVNTVSTDNYGRPFEGGYYTAVPMIFGDIDAHERYNERSLEDGQGMVNVQLTKGIFVAAPFLSMNDVWVNSTSDLRFWIHKVSVKTHIRGVPLIVNAEMRPIPTSNVIYRFPVPPVCDE